MLKYSQERFVGIMLTALGLIVAAIYISLSYGVFDLTFAEVVKTLFGSQSNGEYDVLIYQFRLPRIVIAGLVGAGLGAKLSLYGKALQPAIQNLRRRSCITRCFPKWTG